MDVFDLHNHVVDDYAKYTNSFIRISDQRIAEAVQREISEGLLWPEPLLQLNPSFAPGKRIDQLISEGLLHEDCGRIFRDRLRYDRELYSNASTNLRTHGDVQQVETGGSP